MNEDIILPKIKNLSSDFKAHLKYPITEIELTSITGSDLIILNRDISQKYKSDNNYNIIDDLEFADKLLMSYVKFTYNDQVNQRLFNGSSDIERFQTSHFEEYIEITQLYLNYIVQHLQSINSLMKKQVVKNQVELMQSVIQIFSKEEQDAFRQQILKANDNQDFTQKDKKKFN